MLQSMGFERAGHTWLWPPHAKSWLIGRLWCWEGLGAGGEGDDRGWNGWMASLTLWTWVWVNSGSWWWTGRPGMLLFIRSQRVGHDWATELNWTEWLNWLTGLTPWTLGTSESAQLGGWMGIKNKKSFLNLDNLGSPGYSKHWLYKLGIIQGITLQTKVHIVEDMVFPVVMYEYEGWTIIKATCWRIDVFELWCWRRLLRVPWTARRWNQSILKEINPEYSLEGLMQKLKLQ